MNSLSLFAKSKTEWSLHKDPDKNASIMRRLKVSEGETIDFDQSRIRTVKSGRIVVKKNVTLDAHNFGNITYLSLKTYDAAFAIPGTGLKKFSLVKGNTFEELHYAPEGCCLIQWGNDVFYVDRCPWGDDRNTSFEYVSQPVFEWWVRVTKDGNPLGWFLVDKKISGF
jgi:hypothetical protein